MNDSHAKKFQKDLNAGLVALVLLAVLAANDEDAYGYDIAKRLQPPEGGDPMFKEGTIYPVLRSLSASGWLSSRVVPSYSGPPRRYYRITELGRDALTEWTARWKVTRALVDACLGSPVASMLPTT